MLRNKVLISLLLISSLFAKEIIAVLDLEQIGLTPQEAQILTQRLTTELISLNKYQVVERNNMDKILKEQKFQHSGCTDAECAVEIGQILNTDFIILGSVNKFGSTYAVDARLIDVGLGKSLISAEFSMKGEIDILLTTGMTSIAKQLCDMPAKKTAEPTQIVIPPVEVVIPPVQTVPKAKLNIVSTPPGAKVHVNNMDSNKGYSGLTPLYRTLNPGKYSLVVERDNFDTQNLDMELTNSDTTVVFELIRQQGYLHSAFKPQEAIVTIDGETVANNSTSLLNTGNYKLTAKLTNYYLVNKSVTISKDDTIYINHTLQYGLDDYKKLLKQNKKHGKLFIIPAAMSIATYAVKTYYNSKYENATSDLVKSHYLGIHDIFDTAFTVSSSITLGAGLYITYSKQRAKTLKFQLSI